MNCFRSVRRGFQVAVLAAIGASAPSARPSEPPVRMLDPIAESYVKLVLAIGQHDPDYVDAYDGPAAWRQEAEEAKRGLPELQAWAGRLIGELKAVDASVLPPPEDSRLRFLGTQVRAAAVRIDQLAGRKLTFDEESRLIYDCALPRITPQRTDEIRSQLDSLLPGEGSLADRCDGFISRFIVPRDKIEEVMRATIAEARRRTLEHVSLPSHEDFQLELVTNEPWGAYNWFKGNARSVIQVNIDLPFRLSHAFVLAAHEGYPGHHVHHVSLEQALVHGRHWCEFQVYPLFSPRSVIAEGIAEFGVEVVFPLPERIAFARDVLFPIAGFDPAEAKRYIEVSQIMGGELGLVGTAIKRDYVDGRVDADEAVHRLNTEALEPLARARKSLSFADRYRAYLVTYDAGYALVRDHVESRGGTEDHPGERWRIFAELLVSPATPSGLQQE